MNMTKTSFLYVFALIAALAGCSTVSSHSDCPVGLGAKCKSISEVNSMVNSGEIGGGAYQTSNVYQSNAQKEVQKNKKTKVWLNGYTSKNGDSFEPSYGYMVVGGV